MFGKLARGSHQDGGFFFDKCETHVLGQRLGQRLSIEFIQLRFRVKEIQLAWGTFHENENAVLGTGRKMRFARRQWIRRSRAQGCCLKALSLEQGSKRHGANAIRSRGEKMAPCEMDGFLKRIHGWRLKVDLESNAN
jgi:hypothetical protein